MIKPSIEAKVRPLANPSLDKASLVGAARVYVSKESLLALTNSLDQGKPCVVEKLAGGDSGPLPRRQALLWLPPDKNLSPNVVMMSRAFQDAAGFRVGDQVRIALADAMPDADEVLARDVAEADEALVPDVADADQARVKARHAWEFSLGLSLDRAEHVFPGMLFDAVNVNKLRRSFKVVSVNGQSDNLARFRLASTAVRILQPDECEAPADAAPSGGDLVVTGVPGLASQVAAVNDFLRAFGRPFWFPGERQSCALVIHGGHGTGKTLLLQRIEQTAWGRAHWIRPSDKLATLRESFKLARAQQPSIVLLDGLEDLIAKDRPNREAVVEALGAELDALSAEACANNALPSVVVVATCLDYMTDVPPKLQKRSRLLENVALPIPRAAERLDILRYLDPLLRPEDKAQCLASVAQKTHAYNGDDLANLVLNANRILGSRLDELQPAPGDAHFLAPDDMERALRITRPSAMHDINLKPPTIHWRDVGGQESVKKVLARMIRMTRDASPAAARVLRHPPKGLLLYGPPGCSKTLSAQAMATESGFNFFAVKGAELLNMYVGESERAVRTLFERARAASPSIIFFDEIDAIGGQREGARNSAAVNMLTTLLTEMDGFEALTGVFVLAATNRPEAMDPALLRPGRFDQVLYVGLPDQAAREAVFAVHLRGLALAPDVDVPALARRADGYSGAEIKAACNEAGLAVLDSCDDAAPPATVCLSMADLVAGLERTSRNITSDMLAGYEAWGMQFKP